jgi:hypothetical protein
VFVQTVGEVAPGRARHELSQVEVFFGDLMKRMGKQPLTSVSMALPIVGADPSLTGAQVTMSKRRGGVLILSTDVVVVGHWAALAFTRLRAYEVGAATAEPVTVVVKGEVCPGVRLVSKDASSIIGICDLGNPEWAVQKREVDLATMGFPTSGGPVGPVGDTVPPSAPVSAPERATPAGAGSERPTGAAAAPSDPTSAPTPATNPEPAGRPVLKGRLAPRQAEPGS